MMAHSEAAQPEELDPAVLLQSGAEGALEPAQEAIEAAVRETDTPQQLAALMQRQDLQQLSPSVLVLLCNQLARVTDTSPNGTVRAWTEAQVRNQRC